MKLFFLSYDCAIKSLAVVLFSYDTRFKNKISEVMQSVCGDTIEKIIKVNEILDNVIEFFYMDVIDVCPGFNVMQLDILEKSNLFKQVISKINLHVNNLVKSHNPEIIYIYIERQPIFNVKSCVVYHQLIYEYTNNSLYKIKIMYPGLKNKVYFHSDLTHGNFISNSNNGYKANKDHTKANFLYFIKKFNLQDKIKHIKKKNLDDIGDAFMQVIYDIKQLA
jgi:hypothetical protein